jgi:hypothetical protein
MGANSTGYSIYKREDYTAGYIHVAGLAANWRLSEASADKENSAE